MECLKEVKHIVVLDCRVWWLPFVTCLTRTQGLVLDCGALEFVRLNALPALAELDVDARTPVWLALDEVTDPVRAVFQAVKGTTVHMQ